jgi:hypothetical protein
MSKVLDLPDLEAAHQAKHRVGTALHGPATPDEFRVKVGRFGDRWYHDPLPACDLAPATDDVWPSVTTIKKAAERDWSWVSLERAAHYLEQRRGELDGLNAAEIHARLNEVNKAGLNRAGARGTSIHYVMEALAAGGPLPDLSVEARAYLPACQRFLDEAQPEWLLSEVVSISRSHNYGGTFDAVIRVDGGTYLVDWKTRKPGKHGAYDEEAWQLAAYANADYIIVDVDGTAVRQKMPHLDGAFVISLAPEGYRPYPINLDEAWDSYLSLRTFWDRKRCDHVGKPIRFAGRFPDPPVVEPEITAAQLLPTPELRQWILGRLTALDGHPAAKRAMRDRWPEDMPKLSSDHQHTDAELRLLADELDQVEADYSVPFGQPDPTAPPVSTPLIPPHERLGLAPRIDEGRWASDEDVKGIVTILGRLPAEQKSTLEGWAREAHDVGHSFSIKLHPSERRLAIYRALIALAPLIDDELERVRATVAAVQPDAGQAVIPLGSVIGTLTLAEAEQLHQMALAVRADEPALQYALDGAVAWAFPNTTSTEQETT